MQMNGKQGYIICFDKQCVTVSVASLNEKIFTRFSSSLLEWIGRTKVWMNEWYAWMNECYGWIHERKIGLYRWIVLFDWMKWIRVNYWANEQTDWRLLEKQVWLQSRGVEMMTQMTCRYFSVLLRKTYFFNLQHFFNRWWGCTKNGNQLGNFNHN